jgi:hypothetical protein
MPPRKSCSRQWEEGSAGRGVVRVGGTGGGAALRGRSRVNGAPIAGGVAKPFLRSSGIPTEVEAPGREPPVFRFCIGERGGFERFGGDCGTDL